MNYLRYFIARVSNRRPLPTLLEKIEMEQLEKYLCALLLFQIEAQREDGEAESPVSLLSRAGFRNPEIAKLLNKNLPAVQKALERARKDAGRRSK